MSSHPHKQNITPILLLSLLALTSSTKAGYQGPYYRHKTIPRCKPSLPPLIAAELAGPELLWNRLESPRLFCTANLLIDPSSYSLPPDARSGNCWCQQYHPAEYDSVFPLWHNNAGVAKGASNLDSNGYLVCPLTSRVLSNRQMSDIIEYCGNYCACPGDGGDQLPIDLSPAVASDLEGVRMRAKVAGFVSGSTFRWDGVDGASGSGGAAGSSTRVVDGASCPADGQASSSRETLSRNGRPCRSNSDCVGPGEENGQGGCVQVLCMVLTDGVQRVFHRAMATCVARSAISMLVRTRRIGSSRPSLEGRGGRMGKRDRLVWGHWEGGGERDAG